MKRIINAQNGSIEFDNDDDFEIWTASINTKNTWEFVGSDYKHKFLPHDQVMAIHVFGKNTSASPDLNLFRRLKRYPVGTYTSAENLIFEADNNGFIGIVDINWLFDWKKTNSVLYGQFDVSTLEIMIDNDSNFTGYLFVNVYVKKNNE